MKTEEGNRILITGIQAAELAASVDYSVTMYESVCMYLFNEFQPYLERLRLYLLDENQKLLKEVVVCTDSGIVQGDDLIPLYQLPEEVEKNNKAVQIHEEQIFSLYIPLAFGNKLLGFLLLNSPHSVENGISYFERMGKIIAMGFQRVLSASGYNRYRTFFNKTVEIANRIHTANSVEQLVITFARQTVWHLNFDRTTVFLFGHEENQKGYNYCVTCCGKETANVTADNLPLNIKVSLPIFRKTGYWFPLYTNARQVGLVLFDNLYSQYSIPESYLDMLTPLCNQLATAADNIRLFQDIQRAAERDRLTDLYNRAYFEIQLGRLDNEDNYPLSIIIGDVNGLKITNDIFGHFEGDVILREIANILKSVCRQDDIVARWGGDEYVILLPKTSEKRAEILIHSVKQQCKANRNSKTQLSISMGCATKRSATEEMDATMRKAEERMYRNKLLERTYIRNTFIATMREMLHKNCQEPEEHIDRMDYLSGRLGKYMRLSDNDREELKLLAMLHDIGKVAIRQEILNKSDKLTRAEWNEVRKHCEAGYRIAQASPELSRIAGFILFHHERWDGKGYPMGKKGSEIPLLSRIISVIDAYDVMTHPRVYKQAMSHEQAIAELKRCAGTQFDPEVVANFIELQDAILCRDHTG